MNENTTESFPQATVPPMASVHALRAEQFERTDDIMRPITLDEMMNLNVFFARYGVEYNGSYRKEGE